MKVVSGVVERLIQTRSPTPGTCTWLSLPPLWSGPFWCWGVASVLAGFLVNPTTDLGFIPIHWLTNFLGQGPVHLEVESFNATLAAVSSLVALAGISIAFLMYQTKLLSPSRLSERLRPAYVTVSGKYYFDEAYEGYLVTRFSYGGLARSLDWIDKSIVDRLVNTTGWLGANLGGAIRQDPNRPASGLRGGLLGGYSIHRWLVPVFPVARYPESLGAWRGTSLRRA